jgi:uncharacterized protein (TIGR02271 family)
METRPIPLVSAGRPEVEPEDAIVVPLREENLTVRKERREAGELVVQKDIKARTETIPVTLGYEEVSVERVPVNRVLAEGESAEQRQEGDVLIIPVVDEELVVLKRLVVREEVRITRRRHERREEVTETVRKEELTVEPKGNVRAKRGAG